MKKGLKKLIGLLVCVAMLAAGTTVLAQDFNKVTVNMNGATMNFDVEPLIENSRILVPFRAIFESLDCTVSYENIQGVQYVEANRGSQTILMQIGQKQMLVNGEEVALDVAPKIVNGRTLIPLRAISESLDCTVDWYDDIKTAAIHKKMGQYNMSSGHLTKTIQSDGADLIYINCAYPIIENESDNAFIKSLNDAYQKNAEEYVAGIEKEYEQDAKSLYQEIGKNDYRPMEFTLSYEVNTNRKNRVSITTYAYENTNGAHPNTARDSKTYDLKDGKQIHLTDVLGTTQDNVNKTVYDAFYAYLEKNMDSVTSEDVENLNKELEHVQFYLSDNSLVMYYNPYDIAPYALGCPTVEFDADKVAKAFADDFAEANMDPFTFSLDGNPTTGYSWEIVDADADKLDVKSEYIADEAQEGQTGVGGKYQFTVTGLSQGNATLDCAYMAVSRGNLLL